MTAVHLEPAVTGRAPAAEPATTRPDDVDIERDRVLVERAQAGDARAFDDLYRRYRHRLTRFCVRRLEDSHEAEDVVQEAFARAWKALPTFAGERRFYPWLSVIAAHLCTDIQRRRVRSVPVGEFSSRELASTEDDGEIRALAASDSELVARAFRRLSPRHQRILRLREGAGWSYQAIADHEGSQVSAIETLLWRARQALKREFLAADREESVGARRLAAMAAAAGIGGLSLWRRLARLPGRLVHVGAGPLGASALAAATTAVVAGGMVALSPLGPWGHASPEPAGAAPAALLVARPEALAPRDPTPGVAKRRASGEVVPTSTPTARSSAPASGAPGGASARPGVAGPVAGAASPAAPSWDRAVPVPVPDPVASALSLPALSPLEVVALAASGAGAPAGTVLGGPGRGSLRSLGLATTTPAGLGGDLGPTTVTSALSTALAGAGTSSSPALLGPTVPAPASGLVP